MSDTPALIAHRGPTPVALITSAGVIVYLDPAYAEEHPDEAASWEAYAVRVRLQLKSGSAECGGA